MKTSQVSPQFIASADFCEGREATVIDAIARAVDDSPDICLINVDPNHFLNRTRIIFGGSAEALLNAAEQLLATVDRQIDIQGFEGEITPFGALEFISFIPLNAVHLQTAADLALSFARKASRKYSLPTYLSYNIARHKDRETIYYFRESDYISLGQSIDTQKSWKPDLGPSSVHNTLGAMIVGARLYHINFLMYFDSDDIEQLSETIHDYMSDTFIEELSESADEDELTFLSTTEIHRVLHQLHFFFDKMPGGEVAQLIASIPDYDSTPLLVAIDAFRSLVDRIGIPVLGCKILGFMPAEVLLEAGRACANMPGPQNHRPGQELQLFEMARAYLQLDLVEPFRPGSQLLELMIENSRD